MAKKARQRISYVLENAKSSAGGHRLGVNGLAVDNDNGILYSGGRDGTVCAWDLHLDLRNPALSSVVDSTTKTKPPPTTFRASSQHHMHWINDIALAQNNTALVSASSDLSVKVWRPHSQEPDHVASSIGAHADYVKCIAVPPADSGANWVATGGLDRKICLWDLNGGGNTLEIDVKGEEMAEKGSVYALGVGHNLVASGGPEKVVRLYDPRTGDKISKLVGHVDNIRAILIDESGDTILSAGGDKTVKMWSVKGGRCMYTFSMHDDSVWSLFSEDPRLGIFYSSDRSGMVAKTDVRGNFDDIDNGLSLAVCRENFGVSKVVAAGGHIWTATNKSSINRWEDVDTRTDAQLPAAFRRRRAVSGASARQSRSPPATQPAKDEKNEKGEIPAASILRISNAAAFPLRSAVEPETNTDAAARKPSEAVQDSEPEAKPIRHLPQETIEGQFGLLKHKLLNDRRRVLTLDTAGDVLMWDLVKCKPIQSFGKQHLEDVEVVVNTREAVAPWCSVDLSSGSLTVVLEPFNCFDAEVYADELELDEAPSFREDQRISLGRWILRYLFASLIDEEIKRDEAHRAKLNESVEKRRAAGRANAPKSIVIPESNMSNWETSDQTTTPRANGSYFTPATPGMAIGLATPGPGSTGLPGVPEDAAIGSPLSPGDNDYFTSAIGPVGGEKAVTPATPGAAAAPTPAAETDKTQAADDSADKAKDKDKAADNSKSPGAFGKKFRMSFGTKKLGRSASQATAEKPAVVEEKAEESEESSSNHEKEVDDSFYGVIQKIRNEYEKSLAEAPDKLVETLVAPSLPVDTPVLKLPPNTKVIIQEETSGGSANIYQGTVASVGQDADLIEQKAPMWLGDLLLQNQVPFKEPVKVSFVLHPIGDLVGITAADGNNRLNANRMLRVKKILSYVAERIEAPEENPSENALKPEEYLELYCNDQLLAPTMTLATLRTHVWKGGNDIVLHYKANGKKEIKPPPPPPPPQEPAPESSEAATDGAEGTANAPAQPQQAS
ncbi:hypothetical protein NLU13_5163 [Sarocladium strictum]|uniref:Uncharacterized protein n=1 Tax=Sarocladium strictum TaxID=5046 RepID=A0AA39GGD4_SARSR|nr:hypothetical protein NLU13_5163 [Sarocladium strictum]